LSTKSSIVYRSTEPKGEFKFYASYHIYHEVLDNKYYLSASIGGHLWWFWIGGQVRLPRWAVRVL